MNELAARISASELEVLEVLWQAQAPLPIAQVRARLMASRDWDASTVKTLLRRLCDKGLFRNDNGTVTALISREQFYSMQSEQFVDTAFQGSFPAFLAAFSRSRPLTEEERELVRQMIDQAEEG